MGKKTDTNYTNLHELTDANLGNEKSSTECVILTDCTAKNAEKTGGSRLRMKFVICCG